jgi:hypothetical protein
MNRQGSNLIHMTVRNLTFGFLLCTLLLTGTKTFAGPDDDAYFEQLHFQKITDASDPDFPNITYHWLMAGFPFSVELNPTQDLLIDFSVLLYDSGSFDILYKDYVQDKGASYFFPRACHKISGSWSVPDKVSFRVFSKK